MNPSRTDSNCTEQALFIIPSTVSVSLSLPSSRHDTFTDDAGPFLYKCSHQKHRRRAQNILRRLSRPIANDHQTPGRQGTRSIVLWLLLCMGRQRSPCNHRNRHRTLHRGPPLVCFACPRRTSFISLASPHPLSHPHLRNSYFIMRSGSLLRTRTAKEPG